MDSSSRWRSARALGLALGFELGLSVACNPMDPMEPEAGDTTTATLDPSSTTTQPPTAADSTATSTGGSTGGSPGVPGLCESGDDGWLTATSTSSDTFGEGSGGAEESGFGMGDDLPLATDIYDINQSLPLGVRVEVRDVVVTSPLSVSETGAAYELFVQEPGSGPYSGIRLRIDASIPTEPMPGDVVTVVGQVRGHADHQAIHIDSALGLEITGTGPVPEPIVLSTEDLDDPTSETALAYEGVLVRVEAVTVTYGSPCDGEFEVDATLRVDDRYLEQALPAPQAGDTFTSLSGPLIYVLDSDAQGMELAPRDVGDIQP